jgi:hypothetical protein
MMKENMQTFTGKMAVTHCMTMYLPGTTDISWKVDGSSVGQYWPCSLK